MAVEPALHPALEPFAFLIGTWRGKGSGRYPDIDDFDYLEVATYTHMGKPFIAYNQRTSDATSGSPMHAEVGYLRPIDATHGELVIAQPTGLAEILDIEIHDETLVMASREIARTPTAKQTDAVMRQLTVRDDLMHYRVEMAAMGQGMQLHLEAELTR